MFIDRSFSNCVESKSISRSIINANENIVNYRSKCRNIVTLNPSKADYVVTILKRVYLILKSLKVEFSFVIYFGNRAAIRLYKEVTKAKHKYKSIKIKYSYQTLADIDAKVVYVLSQENLADPLTKVVGKNMLKDSVKKFMLIKRKSC
eukprot:snap_masked-scaffold_9-processed-gene-3.18-mRNA-1 protein AED:1.00 eAED:1.00 QI:0/0/0/0/1/1/2/0/147